MKEGKIINDGVLLGNWEDVQALPLSSLTKRPEDTEILDGIIVRGYEMKWGETNENGEQYDKGCFDKFINDYYVTNGLNVPMDIQHCSDPEWLAGRVVYIETNSVGFYIVGYIPRTYIHFDMVRDLLKNGILQGFSKCGWATDWEFRYKSDGSFDYELVKEIQLVAVSLVATPANGVPFEKVEEIRRNALAYRNMTKTDNPREDVGSTLNKMFN